MVVPKSTLAAANASCATFSMLDEIKPKSNVVNISVTGITVANLTVDPNTLTSMSLTSVSDPEA